MKKSDLKYGNVVELRNGDNLLLCRWWTMNGGELIDLSGNGYTISCIYYCEDLTNVNGFENLDIMKVYKDYTCKELLWERKETPKLTEDEKAILRNLPKEYKWIARDKNGWIFLYTNRPVKSNFWLNACESARLVFPHLFQFIKWEDEEPYSIEDLLKGEEK